MAEWLNYLWALAQANPWVALVGAVAVWWLTNRFGLVVPEAWRKKLYDMCVSVLSTLLSVQPSQPSVNVEGVSDQDALDAFVVLSNRCKGCPAAKEPLKALWGHMEPGKHDMPEVSK